MKKIITLMTSLLLISACSMNKPHEKNIAAEATPLGLPQVQSNGLDAVYLDKTAIANYKHVLLEPLDISAVKIRKPSSNGMAYDTPWQLNEQDRKFYQARYQTSMKKEWLDKSELTQVNQVAANTLKVKAVLVEIVPLSSKDDAKGRPSMTQVYSEGVGTMTLKYELSDASSGKVLGLISDQRDLGKMWEENNRVTFNQQVRRAFDTWARRLQRELN